jgi:hypothetical protein
MRRVPICLILLGLVLLAATPAAAQSAWPPYSTGSTDPHFIDRGFPGPDAGGWYLSGLKLLLYWIVFLFWVRSADWVNRDLMELGERTGMSYQFWNSLVALPFIVSFFFFGLSFPFVVGCPLLIISYVAPFVAYVVHRNSLVRDDERVFTPKNVSDWF